MKEQSLHFGVLSYGGAGHLNSLLALSVRLTARGHRVTFFQTDELEARVQGHGVEFRKIGPPAVAAKAKGRRSGLRDLLHRIRRINDEMEVFLRDAPDAISIARIDALIIDEISLAGPTIAELLKLPYVILSTSVPHHFGWSVPRSLSYCDNPLSLFGRLRNALLQVSVLRMHGPVRWHLDRYRRRRKLGPIREIQEAHPAAAHIATLPECLDFPQSIRAINFHYTGPFVDRRLRPKVEFPWSRLDGRPLIYVSLGTSRKVSPTVFRIIAEACESLGVQVVMSLGGRRNPEVLGDLPGDPVVVTEAPQLKLIEISAMVIHHAGINTVLETLMEGKAMVAIPITHDQPALAARLAWLHVAEVIPEKRLTVERLRSAVLRILNDRSYSNAAREIQRKILAGHGLERAVQVIERCISESSGEHAGVIQGPT